MPGISVSSTRAFLVRVEYLSGGECFAVDSFRLEVPEDREPRALAQALCERSPYCNERVPDFGCILTLEAVDPDDPGRPPPMGSALGAGPGSVLDRSRGCDDGPALPLLGLAA